MKKTLLLLGLMLFAGIGTAMAQRGNARTQSPPRPQMPQPQRPITVNRVPQTPPTVTAPTRPEPTERNTTNRESNPVAANPNGGFRKVKLPRDLDLTDLQKRQIKHIFKEARENGTPKRQVYHQILRVLTPEQEKKFKERLDNLFGIGEGQGGNN